MLNLSSPFLGYSFMFLDYFLGIYSPGWAKVIAGFYSYSVVPIFKNLF